MVVGNLVKDECDKIGTIIKVTEYKLGRYSEEWKERINASHPDEVCATCRPGYVVSVRWQEHVQILSTHVFYEGIEKSAMNFGAAGRITAVK